MYRVSSARFRAKLDRRSLNRAKLARQLLLDRSDLEPLAAIEHLAGLQAQTPQSWSVGLWTRLADFDPEVVGTALTERALVRLPLMRSTIHLVTAADALALRPLAQIPIEGSTLGQYGRHLRGIDRAELVSTARKLVDEQPLIASELGRRLAEHFLVPTQKLLPKVRGRGCPWCRCLRAESGVVAAGRCRHRWKAGSASPCVRCRWIVWLCR